MQLQNPRVTTSITLLKNRQVSSNVRMMEIGCNDGSIISEIATNLNITDLYGVDIDEKLLKVAAEKGIITNKIDLNTGCLPFSDAFFDVVLMEEVVEHLANPDNAIQEAYRVLKADGYFLVSTPNLAWWLNRAVLLFGYQPYWTESSTKYNVGKFNRNSTESQSGHLRLYTLRSLKELLQLYGFNVLFAEGVTYNNVPSVFKPVNGLFTRKASQAEIIVLLTQKKSP